MNANNTTKGVRFGPFLWSAAAILSAVLALPASAQVPGKPTLRQATGMDGRITVPFSPPANPGGSRITGYIATCGDRSMPPTLDTPIPGVLVVMPVTNGRAYTCTVVAVNGSGPGPASDPSNSVIPVGRPGAPVISGVTGLDGKVAVGFRAPDNNGGVAITSYTALCGTTGSNTTTDMTTPSPLIVPARNGTPVTCRVSAKNLAGDGAFSALSSPVTPIGVPDAPTIGTVTLGNEEIRVAFTPGGNGGLPVLGYMATCGTRGANATDLSNPSPIILRGPVSNAPFTCRVMARNQAGNGPFSQPSNSVTGPPATAGGSGGSAFTSDCNSDGVMVGIKVRTGSLVDSVQAVCVKVRSNGSWAGGTFDGARAGGNGGTASPLICESGSAVQSIFGRAGSLIDAIGVICVTMTGRNGIVTDVGSGPALGPLGGTGGSAFRHDCNGGRLAKGISGSAGTLIDKISLNCHNPAATQ